jgi:hypothetical protein
MTVSLNRNVINPSDHSKEAVLSKVLSPRVPHLPEFNSIFHSISNDGDIVYDLLVTCFIMVDPTCVVLK